MPDQTLITAAPQQESTSVMSAQAEKDECKQLSNSSLMTDSPSRLRADALTFTPVSQPINDEQQPANAGEMHKRSGPSAVQQNHCPRPVKATAAATAAASSSSLTASSKDEYRRKLIDPRDDPEFIQLPVKLRAAKARKYRQAQNKERGILAEQATWWKRQKQDLDDPRVSPRTFRSNKEDETRIRKERERRIRRGEKVLPPDPDRIKYRYVSTGGPPSKCEQEKWWTEQKKDLDELFPSPRTQFFGEIDRKMIADEIQKQRSRSAGKTKPPPPSSSSVSASTLEQETASSLSDNSTGASSPLETLIDDSEPSDISSQLNRSGYRELSSSGSRDGDAAVAVESEEEVVVTPLRRKSMSAAMSRADGKRVTSGQQGWTIPDFGRMVDGLE